MRKFLSWQFLAIHIMWHELLDVYSESESKIRKLQQRVLFQLNNNLEIEIAIITMQININSNNNSDSCWLHTTS